MSIVLISVGRNRRSAKISLRIPSQLVLSVWTAARRQSSLSAPPQVFPLYRVRAARKSLPPMFHVTTSDEKIEKRNTKLVRTAFRRSLLVQPRTPRGLSVTGRERSD